jgi:hypothetical protein
MPLLPRLRSALDPSSLMFVRLRQVVWLYGATAPSEVAGCSTQEASMFKATAREVNQAIKTPRSNPTTRRGLRHHGRLARARLQGTTEALGSGAKFRMDGTEQEDELRDYERVPESGEAFMYVAMSPLMVRRLARS